MADHSTCLSSTCGAWADGDVAVCPKCGGPMRGVKGSTAVGWVILIAGLFLVLMTGAITLFMAPSLLSAGEEAGGITFEGTAFQAQLVLLLFGLLILAGAAFALNGLLTIATGRQNMPLTIVGFVLIGLVLLVGLAFAATAA